MVPFMVPARDPSPRQHHGATRRHVQPTVGSPLHSGSVGQLERAKTDRRIEEKVMARKKDKKAQKDKKSQKAQSAQGAPAAAPTTVAPSASPRAKK